MILFLVSMNMKIKQLLLTLFFLVATALMAVFIYELLTSLDSENLVNATQNNVINNNQISIRDVKNITSNTNFSSENSTAVFSNEPTKSTVNLILIVSFVSAAVIVITFLGLTYYWTSPVNSSPENGVVLSALN